MRSDREGIRTHDIEAVTVADMGWGTPLFDLQSDLGPVTSGVLKEFTKAGLSIAWAQGQE